MVNIIRDLQPDLWYANQAEHHISHVNTGSCWALQTYALHRMLNANIVIYALELEKLFAAVRTVRIGFLQLIHSALIRPVLHFSLLPFNSTKYVELGQQEMQLCCPAAEHRVRKCLWNWSHFWLLFHNLALICFPFPLIWKLTFFAINMAILSTHGNFSHDQILF